MKIYIDQGHEPLDPNRGFISGECCEANLVYAVGIELARLLDEQGYDTRLSRPTPESQMGETVASSLTNRVDDANNWGADLFLSLHTGISNNPTDSGTSAIISESGIEKEVAEAILEELHSETGLPNLGARLYPELYILSRTYMPAVIIDLGYISNDDDRTLLEEHPELFAKGIADGIVNLFGTMQQGDSRLNNLQIRPNRDQMDTGNMQNRTPISDMSGTTNEAKPVDLRNHYSGNRRNADKAAQNGSASKQVIFTPEMTDIMPPNITLGQPPTVSRVTPGIMPPDGLQGIPGIIPPVDTQGIPGMMPPADMGGAPDTMPPTDIINPDTIQEFRENDEAGSELPIDYMTPPFRSSNIFDLPVSPNITYDETPEENLLPFPIPILNKNTPVSATAEPLSAPDTPTDSPTIAVSAPITDIPDTAPDSHAFEECDCDEVCSLTVCVTAGVRVRHPVEGAEVSVYQGACRRRIPVARSVTNSRGRTEPISLPLRCLAGEDKADCEGLPFMFCVNISHPEYSPTAVWLDVRDEKVIYRTVNLDEPRRRR